MKLETIMGIGVIVSTLVGLSAVAVLGIVVNDLHKECDCDLGGDDVDDDDPDTASMYPDVGLTRSEVNSADLAEFDRLTRKYAGQRDVCVVMHDGALRAIRYKLAPDAQYVKVEYLAG